MIEQEELKNFDPPLVLSTDNQHQYGVIFKEFVTWLKPKNVIQMQVVAYLAYIAWLVKCSSSESAEMGPPLDRPDKMKVIQHRTATDPKDIRTLDKSAALQNQLNKWLQNGAAGFEDTLQLFECYCNELSQKLRQITAQILGAEFKAVKRRLQEGEGLVLLVEG